MAFGEKFIELNLNYAYIMASIITNIVVKDDEEEFYKYFWFGQGGDLEEYYKDLIDENRQEIYKPTKNTLLHFFIRDLFNMKITHDRYWLKDALDCLEFDDIELNIQDKFVSVLEFYRVEIPDFPEIIETLNDQYENEIITEKELCKIYR